MHYTRTIGLFSAVLIIINIIVGGGIFINLSPLIKIGGAASFWSYLIAGVLLLPVVAVLAALARRHPTSGGLYVYSQTYLGPFTAFVAGWFYYVSKQVSVGLMARLFVNVIQQLIPCLENVSDIVLVAGLLSFFVLANSMGAELQGRVQWLLTAAKGLPILFVFVLFLQHGTTVIQKITWLPIDTWGAVLPIAAFAMIGFEVACTLGHLFKDPDTTIMRALLIGFSCVVAMLTFFQLAVGLLLPVESSAIFPLSALAYQFAATLPWLATVLSACVYTSMIGGAFGILTSNCWNLHRLAEQGHLPFRNTLIATTKNQVPWASLLVGAGVSVFAITITKNLGALQSMGIFGMIFAYACSIIAAFFARTKEGNYLLPVWLKGAAFFSAGCLMYLCYLKISQVGVSTPYVMLLGIGVVVATYFEISGRRAATVVED